MSLRIAVALAATLARDVDVDRGRGAADMVGFRGDYSPGTIVVKTMSAGSIWFSIRSTPSAIPSASARPAAMGRHHPDRRQVSRTGLVATGGGETRQADNTGRYSGGSPRNPMGVAAMTLAGGEYAIHGTNMPGSVGGFVSYGCIRMLNDDITDLYQRVSVGTTVVVSH